jgi:serine protease AprX
MMVGSGATDGAVAMAAGVSWGEPRAKLRMAALALVAAMLCSLVSAQGTSQGTGDQVSVVVRGVQGGAAAVAKAVIEAGGHITAHLAIINGVAAQVPAASVDSLSDAAGVQAVVDDYALRPLHHTNAGGPGGELGTMPEVNKAIGADDLWRSGYTGKGVDIALIDTGVVPVEGLTTEGKVVNGLDISFESQVGDGQYLHMDTNGHGTSMAGIIAGKDSTVTDPANAPAGSFTGVAPDSRLVNVKVAGADGAVDVSQVIAAIDWVVQNRRSNGLNIRVLNLSYGTDSTQSWQTDPLSYAAEVAWKHGIVVVAATGNDGKGSQLAMPAANPYVLAVGASDHLDTATTADDKPASFSTYASGARRPELLAPGVGVTSLRAPGSNIDQLYPNARQGARYLRGSGSSQAAAVVSGAAALLLQQRPDLTPDQVKALLKTTATKLNGVTPFAQGSGLINLRAARVAATPAGTQQIHGAGTGVGSLQAARGTHRMVRDGVELSGERDIHGKNFSSAAWAPTSLAGSSWSNGVWNGSSWSGSSWSGSSWSGSSWSGSSWSGSSWSGSSWSGSSWSGSSWSGSSWSGSSWSGSSWSGSSWSGSSWSGSSWSGSSWSGTSWSSGDWS